MRDAANSIASGMPSRRRQISTTASASSLERDGRRDRRRAVDEQRRGARVRWTSSDGTGQSCSSATRRPSRLVARIFTVADAPGSPRSGRRPRRARARSCRTPAAAIGLPAPPQRCRPAHARLLGDAEYRRDRLGHRGRVADRRPARSPTPRRGSRAPDRAATSSARRVLPTPPTPVSVTSRCAFSARLQSAISASRPTKLVVGGRRFPGAGSSVLSGGKSVRRPSARDLKHVDRLGDIAQPPRSQVDQVDSGEELRRRAVEQDLAAVAGRHHPRGAVEHRAEVVVAAQLGLAGGDAHPHRQFQRPLRGDGGVDGSTRRREHRAHPVAGVLEQPTVVRRNGFAQQLVVSRERGPHRVRVGFPPPGRPLDVGEQERDDPRRRGWSVTAHQPSSATVAHAPGRSARTRSSAISALVMLAPVRANDS